MIDSVVANNTSTTDGGGIAISDGNILITDSEVTASTADVNGGGLHNFSGAINVQRSTFANNSAAVLGGGLASGLGTLNVSNSTFSGNRSDGAGGGIANNSLGTLRNVTLVGNSAQNIGGGLLTYSSLSARNVVIAGSDGGDCLLAGVNFTGNVANFIEDGSCDPDFSGNPMLGPLQNNGGATMTHAPLSGNPLVDAGDNGECVSDDQTGTPRPIDGDADGSADCDIGAVEFVDVFGPVASLNSAPQISTPSNSAQTILIDYFDDGAIDLGSLDNADISITPGPLTISQTLPEADGLTVGYRVEPPDGGWDISDNGQYNIAVNDGEILDIAVTGANGNVGSMVGTFTVAIPEIDIIGSGESIADSDLTPSTTDSTDFGDVLVGDLQIRTFTISNIGQGSIQLTGPVSIAGAGFTVTQPSTSVLNGGQSTTFDVNFLPASVGSITGLVTVSNDDSNENPYTFAVSANAVASFPEVVFSDGFE